MPHAKGTLGAMGPVRLRRLFRITFARVSCAIGIAIGYSVDSQLFALGPNRLLSPKLRLPNSLGRGHAGLSTPAARIRHGKLPVHSASGAAAAFRFPQSTTGRHRDHYRRDEFLGSLLVESRSNVPLGRSCRVQVQSCNHQRYSILASSNGMLGDLAGTRPGTRGAAISASRHPFRPFPTLSSPFLPRTFCSAFS